MTTHFTSIYDFLEKYNVRKLKKTEDQIIQITHTSFGEGAKKASYSVPDDKMEDFYNLLHKMVFEKQNEATIVERPIVNILEDGTKQIKKPLVIDIDFKFTIEYNKRMYNQNHAKMIIELYNKAIRKFIDFEDPKISIAAYLFERDKPYKNTGFFKDGLHIVYPEIITDTKIQFLIRNEVIMNFNTVLNNKEYGEIPLVNSNIEDIVDKSVIEANGWFLYGCTKPYIEPYKLSHIYLSKYIDETNSYTLIEPQNKMTNAELMRYLSIRKRFNPEEELRIKPEHKDLLKDFSKKKEKNKLSLTEEEQKMINYGNSAGKYTSKGSLNLIEQTKLIEEADKLTKLLSDRRSHEYQTWIEVGMCLYNISENLKSTWIEFSKRSVKYKKAECDKWWDNFKKANLSIGSLHLWAHIDSPTEYAELKSSFLSTHIIKSLTMTTQDIATVIYELYKHQYIFVNISKSGEWYEFKNHKWTICPNGLSLRNKIGNEVMKEYLKLAQYYNNIALNTIDDSIRDDAIDKSGKLVAATSKLRDITFKKKIMEECIGFFANDDFTQNLDTNPFLLGFNNGIYDLKQMMFRDGRPEDMVSLSTNLDFPDYEYSEDNETIQEVLVFFSQIFPNKDTRYFALKMLGSLLEGINRQQIFVIQTGVGSNGKSLLSSFMSNVLGEYAGTVQTSFITQKRKDSSAANPEMIKLIGKRMCVLNEGSKSEKINSAVVKEISGSDKVSVRGLYQSSIDILLQVKYILNCNDLPPLGDSASDPALWRRLLVIPFKSKFVDNPDPSNPYEFKIDTSLQEKMDTWSQALILILIKFYKHYIDDGGYGIPSLNTIGEPILKLPFEIETAINEYKSDTNVYAQFLFEKVEKETNSLLKLSDIYDAYTQWHMINAIGGKPISRPSFKKEMEKSILKNCYHTKGINSGYVGWKLKIDIDNENPDFSKSEL